MKHVVSGLREAIAYDGPILATKAIVWALVLLALALKGVDGLQYASWTENLTLYVLVLAVITLIVAARALYRERPVSPIGYLLGQARSRGFLVALAAGAPMLATMIVWTPIFSAAKSAIPLFNSYGWDAASIAADRALLGTDAWRMLQPLLGYPLVTSLLSVAYHLWALLVYAGGIFFCLFVRDRELRAQYLIARFATWTVLGIVIATAFPSLGPCFLEPILGDHRFDEQMRYLHAANEHYRVLVLPVQSHLLASYRLGDHGLGGGISAMPSLHVSTALVSALAVSRVSRSAGAWLYAFMGVIMLGSIHLGYHYAVDSVVAVSMTLVLWRIAGVLARMVIQRGDALQPARVPALGADIALA